MRSAVGYAVLLALIASLVTVACGRESAVRPGAAPDQGGRCPAESARPISPSLLTRALLRHDFRVSVDSDCLPGSVGRVANFSPTSQASSSHEKDGPLICTLYRRPIGRLARQPRRLFEYRTLPTKTYPGRQFLLANLTCSLYLDSPTTRENAALELRRALLEVRDELGA